MKEFSVIQSIVRAGLDEDWDSFKKQVSRLQKRLEKSGMEKESNTLARLLRSHKAVEKLAPSEVVMSWAGITGEELTEHVNVPIDKETGANLCSITFPNSDSVPDPTYDGNVAHQVSSIVKEWQNSDQLVELNVSPTQSLLIYGPPGSGKTMTAHFLARQLNIPLVTARIDGLISSFLGTTARNIANLFEFVNRHHCILLLDEFDALAKLRDDPQEVGEIKRVVNSLLQNLDDRRGSGITIAITNHDRLLDPAIWRRFESQLHLEEPGEMGRNILLQSFLHPIKPTDTHLKIISLCFAGKSGAELERLCNTIKRFIATNGSTDYEASLFEALVFVMSQSHGPSESLDGVNIDSADDLIGALAVNEKIYLKQSELAKFAGCTQSAISKLKKSALQRLKE